MSIGRRPDKWILCLYKEYKTLVKMIALELMGRSHKGEWQSDCRILYEDIAAWWHLC